MSQFFSSNSFCSMNHESSVSPLRGQHNFMFFFQTAPFKIVYWPGALTLYARKYHQRDIEAKLHQPVLVVLLHLISLHPLDSEREMKLKSHRTGTTKHTPKPVYKPYITYMSYLIWDRYKGGLNLLHLLWGYVW